MSDNRSSQRRSDRIMAQERDGHAPNYSPAGRGRGQGGNRSRGSLSSGGGRGQGGAPQQGSPSAAGNGPGSNYGSQQGSNSGSRPGSNTGSRPGSNAGSPRGSDSGRDTRANTPVGGAARSMSQVPGDRPVSNMNMPPGGGNVSRSSSGSSIQMLNEPPAGVQFRGPRAGPSMPSNVQRGGPSRSSAQAGPSTPSNVQRGGPGRSSPQAGPSTPSNAPRGGPSRSSRPGQTPESAINISSGPDSGSDDDIYSSQQAAQPSRGTPPVSIPFALQQRNRQNRPSRGDDPFNRRGGRRGGGSGSGGAGGMASA